MKLQAAAFGRAAVVAFTAALINILWSKWPKTKTVWKRTAIVAAAVFVLTLGVELAVDAVEDAILLNMAHKARIPGAPS